MKVSLKWLQKYVEQMPSAEAVSDAFTFHAFEIDDMQGDMLDIKVLPNRAADCLCHRGIAGELSAILDTPMKTDPLREALPAFPNAEGVLTVSIEDETKCLRYMGALVKGVKVGPSPVWLKEALESVGQRSINNVVDATNYVMLNLGQPLHAFDAGKLAQTEERYAIGVRDAKEGEKITTLSGEEYALTPNIQLITDANADMPIALAGVKGGKAAELTTDTTDIIVESANFDGTTTRRAAQALKLFTDASLRFQNRPSPELCAYGMRDVLALIQEIAGGEVVGVVDEYPAHLPNSTVSVSLAQVNGILGADFTMEEVVQVFRRLGLAVRTEYDVFIVTPSFERTDLTIPENLVEEVGRIIGYDKIAPQELPVSAGAPDQARFRGIEKIKDQLVEQGFTEISTQSFAKKGDVVLANPLDKNMPALRTSLEENLKDALSRAKHQAPLVLAPKQKVKLFEAGTVFTKSGEHIELRMSEPAPSEGWEKFGAVDNLSVGKLEDFGKEYQPKRYSLSAYKPFSLYPFIARDIALWVPAGTEATAIEQTIREHASELLVRLDQFDQFEKEGRISYAFRLVFQSMERTLTDDEVNITMEKISTSLRELGYEVR
ncbi:MAG: phenylalanine--tRNA ligase subunit beta [Minisyncoccia bacterium]